MEIKETSEDTIVVLTLSGQIDSSTAGQLEDVLPAYVQRAPCVVLDLASVPYVSSAGLRVMLKGIKLAKNAGHALVLAGLAPQVYEVFQVSGFATIFRIFTDRAAALAALSGTEA